MPPKKRPRPTVCRQCGMDQGDPDKLSTRRRCVECSIKNARENMIQMATGEGPAAEKWRAAMLHAITTGETKRKMIEERRFERELRDLIGGIEQ